MKIEFFKKQNTSNKIYAGGPSYTDQLASLAENKYWTVLNTSVIQFDSKDKSLSDRTNALKHALQTYGPCSNSLPDLRDNTGASKGSIFHGHVNSSNGTTYVLEWSIINTENRVMALTNFAKHENFSYTQKPLSKVQITAITTAPKNIQIMNRMELKAKEAAEKVERTEANFCRK